jgi:N-carbamoyl-L-amino-acid hydrolase
MTGDEGIKLKDSLQRIGFQGEGRLDASSWDSWVQLHIEQGTRLEESDSIVGVVNSINGTKRCFIEITGKANHAGTTAMDTRTDALAAASEIILYVESLANEMVEKKTKTAVGTVGTINIEPDAINVIPGSVELGIDIRANEKAAINSMIDGVRTKLSRLEEDRSVATNVTTPYNVDPVNMDENCVQALRNGAQTAGYSMTEMHSGAGHDTMMVAPVANAAMLFVESRDGISHNPEEWTDWKSCAIATQVLTEGLASLATKDSN